MFRKKLIYVIVDTVVSDIISGYAPRNNVKSPNRKKQLLFQYSRTLVDIAKKHSPTSIKKIPVIVEA